VVKPEAERALRDYVKGRPLDVVMLAALAGIDRRTMARALLAPGRIRSRETREAIVKSLRVLGYEREAKQVEKAGGEK
jgi:DNA-binding LacI/PurR family transcriptional regulator